MSIHTHQRCWGKNAILFAAALALLTACGGGGSSTADMVGTQAALSGGAGSSEAFLRKPDLAALKRSAALSSADLAAAEQQALAAEASAPPLDELQAGQIAALSDYKSGAVARKALAVRIPVYRFFNGSTGAHFFTTSTAERDNVVANLSPPFSLEGEAFSVANSFSPGLSPVHRFYNTRTGVHFYTISESERANVVATLPHFNYEGVAYHASQVAGAGLIPFYRFYVPSKGFHFYTASGSEKDSIIANQAAIYSFEGIGYYVLDSNWRAEKLPHTGVTSDHCYQAGSDMLVACSKPETSDLNPQQDGHRVAINAMSFSAVGGRALTTCVRDDITGLIWEGKEASGARAGSNTYTNLGNGLVDDASGYVAAVNIANLCGFSDWRLPTRQELRNILDEGRFIAPMINTIAFPNTAENAYWSADAYSGNAALAWRVEFSFGGSAGSSRSTGEAVRLVRGSSPSGPRYSYSTVAYGSDGANNVVNDAWTGLQWRRCEQGRVWSGSACTGTLNTFTHEQALGHARAQSGWRMPNVRELTSLVDLSVSSSAARIDQVAFPGANTGDAWTSSPYPRVSSVAWYVDFGDGQVQGYSRTTTGPVRLVRATP